MYIPAAGSHNGAMLKVCLVYSHNPSSWVSCQKIVENLLKAYESVSQVKRIHIDYSDGMDEHEFSQSCRKLIEARPDVVIFLDHRPHPHGILEFAMRGFAESGIDPEFIFHLYGDFSLTFAQWKKLELLITGKKTYWYAASDRQLKMLSEFIPVEQLEVCPFPVDPKEFYPDAKLGKQFRKEKGWKDGEKIFVFTGRLSRQKRIHQLITVFAEWVQTSGTAARLVLVGDVDKVGEPFLLENEMEGEYFHRLWTLWQAMPEEVRSRIEFHGFRPNKELLSYYNAADFLVNISVHNDEDYGMTCAEALACGLPAILTDWAGFSSFRRPGLEKYVTMIPVKISIKGKLIHLRSLTEAFISAMAAGTPPREEIARLSLLHTGIENVSKIVKNGLKKTSLFTTFTPTLHEAAHIEQYQRWCTFSDRKKKTFNQLYMRVYRHYVE